MKKTLIGSLVAINIALVLALVLGQNPAKAQQVPRGYPDYLAIAGRVATNVDCVFVLDMPKRKLAAFEFDPAAKRVMRYRARDLKKDFGE